MQIQFTLVDFMLVSPALALFLASIIPIGIKIFRGNKEQNSFGTLIYAYMGLVAAAGLTVATHGAGRVGFDGAVVFDGLSALTNIIVLLVAAVALSFSRDSLATNNEHFSEHVFLILNAAIGMMTVAWSNDLIITFIGIEVMSLSLYILIAISSEEKLSKEAAFKYFILGSFASALMLYGIAFIYGTVGSTYLPELVASAPNLLATNRMFLIGFILMIVGVLFKLAVFPFHAWTPDVYQGSPTSVTSFMATGVKTVMLAFFLRVIASQAFTIDRFWPFVDVLQWMAVFTILVGNIGAFRQQSLKRMLAYSSIAHSGYLMIGLIAAGIGGASMLGASGVMFYVLGYAIMTLGAFGVVHVLESASDSDLTISDLSGLAKTQPIAALTLTILLLSLAGIPPTVGFFGKFILFSAAIKQGLLWLAVWGVIGSVISVYYYLRPVVAMYMQESFLPKGKIQYSPLSQFVVTLLALMVLGIGVAAEPFYQMVLNSVAKIF